MVCPHEPDPTHLAKDDRLFSLSSIFNLSKKLDQYSQLGGASSRPIDTLLLFHLVTFDADARGMQRLAFRESSLTSRTFRLGDADVGKHVGQLIRRIVIEGDCFWLLGCLRGQNFDVALYTLLYEEWVARSCVRESSR